jgi:hypothetical protein
MLELIRNNPTLAVHYATAHGGIAISNELIAQAILDRLSSSDIRALLWIGIDQQFIHFIPSKSTKKNKTKYICIALTLQKI